MTNKVILDNNYYNFVCPHCEQGIQVHKNDINCRIFRHAVYKNNMRPINPHMAQNLCEKLVETNQVFGCAKPFRLVLIDVFNNISNNYIVEICEYL